MSEKNRLKISQSEKMFVTLKMRNCAYYSNVNRTNLKQ